MSTTVTEDNAELYDPAAGTFSLARGLGGVDGPPQATLLLNGRVLFTGGNDIGGSERSAELYDPATGTFAFTGSMATARNSHTANLLPDGTALVLGGGPHADIQYPATDNGEQYDPATGRFSATADMTSARAGHTAILLNSGQVLITGGSAFGSLSSISAMSSAELYTPAVLVPAPVLLSLSGDGRGQGAIWHATTGEIASPSSPAVAGETLSMYTTSLADGGVILPQVAIGGRLGEVLHFGASGYPGYNQYNQVNFRVASGVAPASAVPVCLIYLGRPSK